MESTKESKMEEDEEDQRGSKQEVPPSAKPTDKEFSIDLLLKKANIASKIAKYKPFLEFMGLDKDNIVNISKEFLEEQEEKYIKRKDKDFNLGADRDLILQGAAYWQGSGQLPNQPVENPALLLAGEKYLQLHHFVTSFKWAAPVKLRINLLGVPNQVGNNPLNFPLLGRESTISTFVKAIENRQQLRSKGNAEDKTNNPQNILQASPGGGKSFLCDVFATHDSDFIQKYTTKGSVARTFLESALGVSVTYNGASPYNIVIDGGHPETGLAARLIWSFYFEKYGASFDSFYTQFANTGFNFSLFTLKHAVRWILAILPHISEGKKSCLLLCVDELLRSAGQDQSLKNPEQLLSAVGDCLLIGDYEAFTTSTHLQPGITVETGSKRPIVWHVASPLSLENSLQLFNSKFLFPTQQPQDIPSQVLTVIQDCNGHPRSLETAAKVIQKYKSFAEVPSYRSIIDSIMSSWPSIYGKNLTLSLIQPAILQKEVKYNEVVPGMHPPKTFGDVVAEGTYLNSLSNDTSKSFIPLLSPLWLIAFARSFDTNSGPEGIVARFLREMLDLEPNFNWESFENFHAYWEACKRYLLGATSMSFNEFYRGTNKKILTSVPDDFKIQIQAKTRVVKLANKFPSTTFGLLEASKAVSLESDVLLCAKDNPGCDIVIIDKTPQGKKYERVSCGIEIKYSDAEATTKVSEQEIVDKHSHFMSNFSAGDSLYQAAKLRKSNEKYFIFAALRTVPESIFNEKKIKKDEKPTPPFPTNTIILRREDFRGLYGETLWSRPQFITSKLKPVALQKTAFHTTKVFESYQPKLRFTCILP